MEVGERRSAGKQEKGDNNIKDKIRTHKTKQYTL